MPPRAHQRRRPAGGARRAPAARPAAPGVSGSNADASARSALNVSSAPSGSASRSSASRLRGDLLASAGRRRSAPTGRRVATGHDDRARLPALDPVDVERRLGRRADVELGSRPSASDGRAPTPRELAVAGRAASPSCRARPATGAIDAGAQRLGQAAVGAGQDRGERLVQRVERVQRGAAVHAGVRGLGAGADLEVGEDHPARGERQRGRVGVDHPAVEDDHGVGAALVGAHPLADVVGAGLLGALDQHAHVDRQLAGVGHRAGDVQQRKEVALVVGRAAGVEAAVADRRLERRATSTAPGRPGPGRRSGRRSSPSARRRARSAARPRPAARRRASSTSSRGPAGATHALRSPTRRPRAAPPRRARRPRSTGSAASRRASSSSSAHW